MSLQPETTPNEKTLASFADAHLRRNFAVLATDYGLFGLGMSFASASTILPAFAEHLGASNLIIGAIPSVMTLGYALPPLFLANHTERLSRKLRFVLTWTVWERLPLLFIALIGLWLAKSHPTITLLSMLLCLATITGVGGALMPAWMDLIGKVIPTTARGRLFALGNVLGSGLGLFGTAVSGYYLAAFAFPLSYTLCFATGFLFLVLSFFFLAMTAEPEVASTKEHVGFGDYLRSLPAILARDHAFTWYLASRCLGVLGGMAAGFYTVYALRNLGAAEGEVARFTFVILASQTVANLAFGYLADHVGHKAVLTTGTAAVVLGNVIALGCTRVEEIYLVFVCTAISTAAGSISANNISMEFAPVADRPTYIGLGSTITAPLAFLAPLIGGFLADSAGYPVVFAVSAVVASLSFVLLVGRVRDPRVRARAAG